MNHHHNHHKTHTPLDDVQYCWPDNIRSNSYYADDSNDIDTLLLLLLLSPAALELNGGNLLLYIAETVMMMR